MKRFFFAVTVLALLLVGSFLKVNSRTKSCQRSLEDNKTCFHFSLVLLLRYTPSGNFHVSRIPETSK